SKGIASIGPASEAVQHLLIAVRVDLKHDARTRCAAVLASSIEIAFRVADHTSVRVATISPTREVVQHRRIPCWTYLVYHAIPVAHVRLADEGGPVDVAFRVADQIS